MTSASASSSMSCRKDESPGESQGLAMPSDVDNVNAIATVPAARSARTVLLERAMRHNVVESECQEASSAASGRAMISSRAGQSTTLSRDDISAREVMSRQGNVTDSSFSLSAHGDGPRLLFIPVSAQQGAGEYARAREIALAVSNRLPHAQIHFVLSKAAPYAASVPFSTTWLPSSATFHPQRVAKLIREYLPTLVIFDNAGRTAQLKAAHEVGARIVFVSSRPRQRRKAFRLHWMQLIDEHWIAYPEFVAGSLSWFERLKLALPNRPVVRFMDTVMPETDLSESESVVKRFGLQRDHYVLVVPGGGTGHPGAENAPQVMAEAAQRLAMRGHPTILVGKSTLTASSPPLLRHAPSLPMSRNLS